MVQGESISAPRYIREKLVPGAIFFLSVMMASAGVSLADETRYQPSGPLNIRNQMPMYIFYMSMPPDTAQTLKKGRYGFEAGYQVANNIVRQNDPWPSWKPYRDITYDITIDGEINRIYAGVSYGLLDNLELAAEMPFFIYSGGYLDSFIHNFEKAFSIIRTPSAREERPENDYYVKLYHYGEKIIEDTSKPKGSGEMTLSAKYKLFEEAGYRPTFSLRAAMKLPTATQTDYHLLGSDKVDFGFGLLADKHLSERLTMYANANMVFIQKPEVLDKLEVDSYMFSGMLGFEFFLTNRTSMLLQATANTSLYAPGVNCMKHDAVILNLGFNHNFSDRVSWQIAMDENTNTASPDFGLFTSLKVRL